MNRFVPRFFYLAILAVSVFALAGSGSGSSAWAATLTVTSLNDSGPGSLRQAIAVAGSGDTINFGVYGTITLTSGPLIINQNLDIEGPGSNRLKISGNHASRVFVVFGGPVTISGMTISDGLADGASPFYPIGLDTRSTGGAILNLSSLVLSDVVLSGNQAIGDVSLALRGAAPLPIREL
jgi:hypothetical protein